MGKIIPYIQPKKVRKPKSKFSRTELDALDAFVGIFVEAGYKSLQEKEKEKEKAKIVEPEKKEPVVKIAAKKTIVLNNNQISLW